MPETAKLLYEMILNGDKIIHLVIEDGIRTVHFESFWAPIDIPFGKAEWFFREI